MRSLDRSPRALLFDSAMTDAAGRFALPAFADGETAFTFDPTDAAAFRLKPTGHADDGRLDLGVVVAPAGRPVTGTVLDAAGRPVAGATVSARSPTASLGFGSDGPLRSAETDAAGRFALLPLPVGNVQLSVSEAATAGSLEFPDGMAVPAAYFATAAGSRFSPVLVSVPPDGPATTVDLRPTPQVHVVVRAVDPQGRPAEPLAAFVIGRANGVAGAWLALASGPDTVEATVPRGATAAVGINDLSADDGRTVARLQRPDGTLADVGTADLGTLTADRTELTVVRVPRPQVTLRVTDADGRPVAGVTARIRYAKPTADNPYRDRLTRGTYGVFAEPQGVFPNQAFTVEVSAPGFTATESGSLTLGWDEHRMVDVRLSPLPATRPAVP